MTYCALFRKSYLTLPELFRSRPEKFSSSGTPVLTLCSDKQNKFTT